MSAYASITFNLGDHFSINNREIQSKYILEGGTTNTRRLILKGKIKAIGIRFKPSGAYPFFSMPLNELANTFLSIDNFELKHLDTIYQRIAQDTALSEKIFHLEHWLFTLLNNNKVIAPTVGISLEMIKSKMGRLSIKEVMDKVFVSQRQLERLFKEQVGMSPKKYARIMRVAQARNALKTAGTSSTTDIGYLVGYYDQSHFIHEFKTIVGLTPKNYLNRNIARQKKLSDNRSSKFH